MADDSTNVQAPQQPLAPNPALRSLDRLTGKWEVSGQGIEGQVTFEWMDGGYFLMQHVNLVHEGTRISGLEIIGYDDATNSLKSHYFGNMGDILQYTWELNDGTLTIWYGEAGSPSKFTGKFSADGNSNTGGWEWPGGGYESTMTRTEAIHTN